MKKLLLLLIIVPMIGFGQECVSGDCENGFGVKEYENGQRYMGKFYKGEYEGLGTMTWGETELTEDGTWTYFEYRGDWENGKPNGSGITSKIQSGFLDGGYVFKDLIWSYTGEYSNDQRNGIGVIKHSDDTGYVGYWVNDMLIKKIAEF